MLNDDPVRRHQWGRVPRIVALNGLALLASNQQDLRQAEWSAHAALKLARRAGDVVGYAYALGSAAKCMDMRGDSDRALALHEESLTRVRETGDLAGIWRALNDVGVAVGLRGEFERVEQVLGEALAVARTLGCPWQIGASLNRLGQLAYWRGDLDPARALLEESIAVWQPVRATRGPHFALATLAAIALDRGDLGHAFETYCQSLALCDAAGDRAGVARCLDGIAATWTASALNDAPTAALNAALIFGAAAALRMTLGVILDPDQRPAHRRAIAATRAALGAGAFEAAWAKGQTMDVARAIAHVRSIELPLQVRDDVTGPTRLEQQAKLLTAREREIVALLGRSRTNRQIAEELVTSERTIETHARNIREKLGLETRAQLIAWAVEQRLTTARD
jgi:DNA-binding CsgD family transcriptional regulator